MGGVVGWESNDGVRREGRTSSVFSSDEKADDVVDGQLRSVVLVKSSKVAPASENRSELEFFPQSCHM